MHGIKLLFVSVLVAFTHGTNHSLFSNWQPSWIIGGTDAAPGEFPFLASVRWVAGNVIECGGSIISNSYILTAAHCVPGKRAAAFVAVVGTNELDSAGQRHTISRIIIHDGFDRLTRMNDIALLKLKRPMVYSSTIQTIALPNQDEAIAPGTECIFSGWGYTEVCTRTASNKLQKLQLTIVPNIECQRYYTDMSDTKICATAGPGKSPHTVDSGGPLVCGGKQIGIFQGVGTKYRRCPIGLPNVHMHVSKYINWITQHAV